MWKKSLFCGLVCFLFSVMSSDVKVGKPLYLTPLLDEGKVAEAQQLAKVQPDIGNVTSFSGYFTVNKECESNLFFWYFPARRNSEKAPVVLWLPNSHDKSDTFMFSLFEEIGPYIYQNGTVSQRKYSWNNESNLLFIDQSLGEGYSFSTEGCYPTNFTMMGVEFYSAVTQFYKLFPALQENKFFISGYSDATKYILPLGHEIHKNNPSANVKINLRGMMIGNAWLDVVYTKNQSEFLYQIGLIDYEEKETLYNMYNKFLEPIKKEDWAEAFGQYIFLEFQTSMYIGNIDTGNYLKNTKWSQSLENLETFLKSAEIRKAIHVGNESYTSKNFIRDPKLLFLSLKPLVEELIEHYDIVFYNGQMDLSIPYTTTVRFLRDLTWNGSERYKNAPRQKWCVGGVQVAYYKGEHHLYEVMVRNTGHSAVQDQPLWTYTLANSIFSNGQDNPLHALNKC